MDRTVWNSFEGQRVLLLQGPVGPFFARVAKALSQAGAASVHKINFSGGDWLFYRAGAVNYRGSLADWPAFLDRFLERHSIDAIVLFGDCRPVHAAAIDQAARRGLTYWVFEEGYIRPNYVTFERHGVNGFSGLPSDAAHYAALPVTMAPPEEVVGPTFHHAALQAMAYYTAGAIGRAWFRHHVHHRPLNMLEGLVWWRSLYRKIVYKAGQAPLLPQFSGPLSRRFFLIALQTAGDSQVTTHSRFRSVAHFIEEVVASFAQHAPADLHLVVKHHPLDRGYHDYTELLRELGRQPRHRSATALRARPAPSHAAGACARRRRHQQHRGPVRAAPPDAHDHARQGDLRHARPHVPG